MRRAATALAFMVALTGCGGGDDDAEDTSTTQGPVPAVVEQVRAAIADGAGTEGFETDPIGGDGRIVCVDGESVRLYVFGSEDDRAVVSERIDPADPSDIGNAIVSWVGTPRLWADGAAIVMYSGADEDLVADLTDGLGPPFSASRGGGAALPELPC